MWSPDTSFVTDQRAVAPVVGFVLLFGLAVIAFSGYQATQVPQQNAETEFQHYEDVQSDLIVVRNSISRAGQTDTPQFESVRLGTSYRERVLALNPPDVRGTLRTSDSYNITIEDVDDTESQNVSTRFLEYENGYNELSIGNIYYENSVLYLDERDDEGGFAVIEEQNLVTDNGSVRITALQNDYEESAVGRASIELYPVEEAGNLSEFDGDIIITVPTRLSGSEYWDEAIGSIDSTGNWEYGGTEIYADIHRVKLTVNVTDLKFNTVGIDSAPESESSTKRGLTPSPSSPPSSPPTPSSPTCVSGNRNVNQRINQDLAYTGSININRDVDGNVIAGGNVILNSGASVSGYVRAGGSVTLNSGSRVEGDVTAGGPVTVIQGGRVSGSISQNNPGYSPCDN
jgi:hypothetical protein